MSSLKAGDLEPTTRTIIEAVSWMDWWTYSDKFHALHGLFESKKLKHLFVAGARCQLLVAKMASTMWANHLKCHDAVLGKLQDNLFFRFLYGAL